MTTWLASARMDDCGEEREKSGDSSLVKRLLETRNVLLCGPVTDDMSRQALAQLLLLDADDCEKPIRVYINSPGGGVDAGFAIYDMMKFVKSPVHTVCAGLAASAATVILLGADEKHRYALPHTRFLLHQPSTGVQGQASDVVIGAKEILNVRKVVNELLAEACGQDVERIKEDTSRDFWMSADQALEYGLIDSIVESASKLP